MDSPVPFLTPTSSGYDYQTMSAILGLTPAAIYVSETSVGGLPAIGRGIDMVSSAVATMMVGADVVSTDGNKLAPPRIVGQPNVLMGTFECYQMVVRSLMMRGNFVGILADFDEDGYARQLVPVNPSAVQLDLSTGWPIYRIGNNFYRYDEVIHLRANAPVGDLWGHGIIERYRTALEGALYGQAFGTNGFKTGGTPSVHVQLDTDLLTAEQAESVQSSFISTHGSGNRKPFVSSNKMSITPLSFNPQDMEFVESRKLSIAECAQMCGLDPSDLGASLGGQSLTYANLTQRELSRISDSYGPWLRLVEEGWSRLVPNAYVKGNPEALLRTSTSERYELHRSALDAGWMTVDEVRQIEGLTPLTPVQAEVEVDTEIERIEPND